MVSILFDLLTNDFLVLGCPLPNFCSGGQVIALKSATAFILDLILSGDYCFKY